MDYLSDEQTTFLTNLVNTLTRAKIEVGVIGPWGPDDSWIVGAMTSGAVYALIGEAPEFPGIICISRVDKLRSRLNVFADKSSFKIGYTEVDGHIRSLELSNRNVKVQFRCDNEKNHKVPKSVFTEVLTSFDMKSDLIQEVLVATQAFDKDGVIEFSTVGKDVVLTMKDDNGDKYTSSGLLADNETELTATYSAAVVGDLLKLSNKSGEVANVSIGTKNILCIEGGSHSFYVMSSKEVI